MITLDDAVRQALSALYRVEVKSSDPTAKTQEVAYAIPVSCLLQLADITGADLPDTIRAVFPQVPGSS